MSSVTQTVTWSQYFYFTRHVFPYLNIYLCSYHYWWIPHYIIIILLPFYILMGSLICNARDGNLILTALAIGRVPLINSTKSLRFLLAQVVLTLAWACGQVLISNPVMPSFIDALRYCYVCICLSRRNLTFHFFWTRIT